MKLMLIVVSACLFYYLLRYLETDSYDIPDLPGQDDGHP